MKAKRHAAITKIIGSQDVETQEELALLLHEAGFNVTQATVSRDIKELRLVKVLTSADTYKYATVEKAESDIQDRFVNIFSRCVVSIVSAGSIIVIKTLPGSASAAAEAIDSSSWPEIAGTIAGDNTIFVAVRDAKNVPDIIKRFQKMIK